VSPAHDRALAGARRVRQLFFPAPAGALEGVLFEREGVRSPAAAVFCHPHPEMGGTLHNKVTYRASEALFQCGLSVLRFNFRGVGRSAGAWSGGSGEEEDARAAVTHLLSLHPGVPLLLGGFSFGAGVALAVGAHDPRVAGLLGVAPSPSRRDLGFLSEPHPPLAVVQGEADGLCPVGELEAAYATWAEPKHLARVAGAGHFFEGRIPALQDAVRQAVAWGPLSRALGLGAPVEP
jgi:hypothetical protein